jgi:aryl-alcohol dehydrogenase-like predicted oxidoreductase
MPSESNVFTSDFTPQGSLSIPKADESSHKVSFLSRSSSQHQLSKLGFGTSGIMGSSMTAAGRLRLLEAAFDQGVRHFDTAPLYGMGLAEEVLAIFARGRRSDITITSKFGLLPPSIHPLLRPALPIARTINRHLCGHLSPQHQDMANRAIRALPVVGTSSFPGTPGSSSPGTGNHPYKPAEIRHGLEESLRKLRTDYIDFYLLDECQSGNLDEEVISLLDALVVEGKIRAYGLGSGRKSSREILCNNPTFRGVVQIPDHLLNHDTPWFVERAQSPLFTHSVLRTPLRSASYRPTLDLLLIRWAEQLDEDPRQPELLTALLVTGALLNNPHGCVLFSTSKVQRITSYVDTLQRFPAGAQALQDLLSQVSSIGSLPQELAA